MFKYFNSLFVIFAYFRYMQSFLELLEYENKSPEDPHVLDEWVSKNELLGKISYLSQIPSGFVL